MPESLTFPPDFVWGCATAAYQIEGAVHEDGRGVSIWDTFTHTPRKILNGDNGDVAVDHYHRWREDLDLIADMGLDAYRFSLAWPRILPDGRGALNHKGLDFYSALVDRLLELGIKPIATLYHWDLPQTLQDEGGWANRATAEAMAHYASVVVEALGDRVHTWTTFNEPFCIAHLGHGSGVHAPGLTDGRIALTAAHHLNLAHGLAGQVVRDLAPQAELSVTLNLQVVYPASDRAEDIDAARRIDAVSNRIFLNPMLEGNYPADLLADTAHVTDWSFVRDQDLKIANIPIDVLGVNYYSTKRVQAWDGTSLRKDLNHGGHSTTEGSSWVGADNVDFLDQPGPYTQMGWNIDPGGLKSLLLRLAANYPNQRLMITENGAAYDDEVASDGHVHDQRRIDYLRSHIAAMGEAMEAGAKVSGYFVWSLLDNFEWALGYDRRFGVVHVDYRTLQRTVKDSAHWYRNVAHSNALERDDVE